MASKTPLFRTSTRHHPSVRPGHSIVPATITPDLGLSTRSVMRRALSAGVSIEEFVCSNPSLRRGDIYRDSQVREYQPAPEVAPAPPTPEPVPVPTPSEPTT